MTQSRRSYLRQLAGVVAGATLGGCTSSGSDEQSVTTVRVGSESFPEQEILGQLAYERLRGVDGIQAVNEIGYGDSVENWQAVADGTKDLYWEYTGTAWSEIPPRHDERITDPGELYDRISTDAREQGIRLATPARFSNEWVLVADRAWSERTGVSTISDLASHLEDGNTDVGVAFSADFYRRGDAWPGAVSFYGIGERTRTALERAPFVVTSIGLTYERLDSDEIQIANGFATDPQIDQSSVVELDDDRNYFMPYRPFPTAHGPTIEREPRIFETLKPVADSLDRATMRDLNRRVMLDGDSPSAVASTHLEGIGAPA